jgi:hypothetical protein
MTYSSAKIVKSCEGTETKPMLRLSFLIKVNLLDGNAEFQLNGSTKFKVVSTAEIEQLVLDLK